MLGRTRISTPKRQMSRLRTSPRLSVINHPMHSCQMKRRLEQTGDPFRRLLPQKNRFNLGVSQ